MTIAPKRIGVPTGIPRMIEAFYRDIEFQVKENRRDLVRRSRELE